MNSTKWFVTCFVIISVVLAILGSVNVYMDPYWSFESSNQWNNKQIYPKDERLFKSNYLNLHGKKYDTLLFGSSISTYINVNKSKQGKAFNFATSSFRPEELAPFIDFAIQKNPNLKIIYIGFDFNEYFKNEYGTKSPKDYITKVSDPFFVWKSLLTYSQLKDSYYNFINNRKMIKHASYNRNHEAITERYPIPESRELIKNGLSKNSMSDFTVDPKFKQYISISKRYPQIKFKVFTTPASAPRLKLSLDKFRNEYKEWLRLIVDEFERVDHFAYINSYTSNTDQYYYDSFHFYPEMGDLILRFLEGEDISELGTRLTTHNINSYLESI